MQPREVLADLIRVQLPQAAAEVVVTALFARQDEVVNALKEEAITATAHTSLKDFDWKLNQQISSDTISSLSEPSLILRFSLAHNDRTATATIAEVSVPCMRVHACASGRSS
jgi:diketogulonate reductase-like aldo/keto reductase